MLKRLINYFLYKGKEHVPGCRRSDGIVPAGLGNQAQEDRQHGNKGIQGPSGSPQ